MLPTSLDKKIITVLNMKEATLYTFLFTSFLLLVAARESYKQCKGHTDPSFVACIEEAANIYFANLDEDVGGIHDAWQSNKQKIDNPPFIASFSYNISKFYNTTKSIKVTLKYDASTKTLSGTIKAPHVGFVSDVDVNGKIFNITLLGTSKMIYHIYDMDSSFETKLHIKPESDTKFEMEELQFKINKIRNAELEVVNIKAANKNIEDGMRLAARYFPNQIYALSKPVWDSIIKEHYVDLTREFLKEMLDDNVITN